MAPKKKHAIHVRVAKRLNVTPQEAKALQAAFKTSSAQVLKHPDRAAMSLETNVMNIGPTRRPRGKKKAAKVRR